MAKGGLSNTLLDKMVEPAHPMIAGLLNTKDGYKDWFPGWPENFEPNLSGQHVAKIVAAWVSDGRVQVALVDPWGHTCEVGLSLVKVRQ